MQILKKCLNMNNQFVFNVNYIINIIIYSTISTFLLPGHKQGF